MSHNIETRRQFAKRLIAASAALVAGLPQSARSQTFETYAIGPVHVVGPNRFALTTVLVAVDGNVLYGANDIGQVKLLVNRRVILWKGLWYRGVNALTVNDFLLVWGRIASNGDLQVTNISVNPSSVDGNISSVSGNSLVITTLVTDQSGSGFTTTNVQLYDQAVFVGGASYSDCVPGAAIRVFGTLGPDGTLRGTSVRVDK